MAKKKFKRQNSHLKRLRDKWRRPRGHQSKLRLGRSGKGAKPSPGYGSPNKGLHPSGYYEVIVRNIDDLDDIDPEIEAGRLSSKLGKRKRQKIREKAEEKNIKLLN